MSLWNHTTSISVDEQSWKASTESLTSSYFNVVFGNPEFHQHPSWLSHSTSKRPTCELVGNPLCHLSGAARGNNSCSEGTPGNTIPFSTEKVNESKPTWILQSQAVGYGEALQLLSHTQYNGQFAGVCHTSKKQKKKRTLNSRVRDNKAKISSCLFWKLLYTGQTTSGWLISQVYGTVWVRATLNFTLQRQNGFLEWHCQKFIGWNAVQQNFSSN